MRTKIQSYIHYRATYSNFSPLPFHPLPVPSLPLSRCEAAPAKPAGGSGERYTKTAHEPKRPTWMSKTAPSYIQNGPLVSQKRPIDQNGPDQNGP